MSFKIHLAKILIKLGRLLQDMPVFILKPRDLIRFGQISYTKPSSLSAWAHTDMVDSGLFPGEKELFSSLPFREGRLLLLGMGGGREAIYFAKAGFQVTGVDFVKELVKMAMANARQRGVEIKGRVAEITRVDFKPNSYDVVWYSCSLYSAIPGQKARIESLRRAAEWLNPGGVVVCGFLWNPLIKRGKFRWKLGKIVAWLTLGNRQCEPQDFLINNLEFLHAFASKQKLEAEFREAGFEVIRFYFPQHSSHAGALLRKRTP